MRVTFLIAATAITAGWLAACSKPSSDQSKKVTPDSARHIMLAGQSTSDAAVTSDLEAGRPTRTTQAAPRSQQTRNATSAAPQAEGPLVAAVPVQVMSLPATSTEAQPPLDLVTVPAAAAPEPTQTVEAAAPAEGGAWGYHGHGGYTGEHQGHSLGGNQGPAIIIRGGLGGTDDKCDLRPRGFRGGIAINRMAPGFGGYGRGIR